MEKVYDVQWRYNYGDPLLRFLLWDTKTREKRISEINVPSLHYIFFRVKDYENPDIGIREIEANIEGGTKLDYGEVHMDINRDYCYRLQTFNPYAIRDLSGEMCAKKIPNYEGDLNYLQRLLIDHSIQIDIPEANDVLYFDIEADARDVDMTKNRGDATFLSCYCVDTDGNEFEICNEGDEKEAVYKMIEILDRYPIIAGYFSNRFDYPYLEDITKRLEIDYDFSRVVHFDVFSVYRYILKKNPESESLSYVAKKESLGGKTQIYHGPREFYEAWKNDRENFLEYNRQDACLARDLSRKYEMEKIFFSMARDTYTTIPGLLKRPWMKGRDINFYKAVDSIILHVAKSRDPRLVFRTIDYTQYWDDGDDPKFKGAEVFKSIPGLHENCAKLDFASLYVNLIKDLNIGPDTQALDGGIKGIKVNFKREPRSIFSEAIDYLDKQRQRYKDKRAKAKPGSTEHAIADAQQFGVKQISLSTWGGLGYGKGRYFDPILSEEITGAAREVMIYLRDFLEEKGHIVITGDTDASTVKLIDVEGDMIEYTKELTKSATKHVRAKFKEAHNLKECTLEVEFEKFYHRFWMPDVKKKYVGLIIWQEGQKCMKIEKVGMETVRGDWPAGSKEFQDKLIKMKLRNAKRSEVRKYCLKVRSDLFAGKYDKDLIIWKAVKKEFEDYRSLGPQVRAAKELVNEGYEFYIGDKAPYIKYGVKPDQVIACPNGEIPEDWEFRETHYKYLWQTKYEPILERLGYKNMVQTSIHEFGKV